jgi:ABC-type transport system involved in cytochrome c biogenesis permease subunit
MNLLGISHILLLLTAYTIYLLTTLRSFSEKTPYRLLFAANVFYAAGFVLGMLWSNEAWGNYLSFDPKIIISILVPLPYILENILRTKKWHLPAVGALLIALNYILPQILSSVHALH